MKIMRDSNCCVEQVIKVVSKVAFIDGLMEDVRLMWDEGEWRPGQDRSYLL